MRRSDAERFPAGLSGDFGAAPYQHACTRRHGGRAEDRGAASYQHTWTCRYGGRAEDRGAAHCRPHSTDS